MNNIKIFEKDLPKEIDLSDEKIVALDCEALGLVLGRDPLTLVQIGLKSNKYFLVKLDRETYEAPNLQKLLSNPETEFIQNSTVVDLRAGESVLLSVLAPPRTDTAVILIGDYAKGIDSGLIEVLLIANDINMDYLNELEKKLKNKIGRKVVFSIESEEEGIVLYDKEIMYYEN